MILYEIGRIRTNNFKGTVIEDISSLWKQVAECLNENKSDVYAIYHEYESNYTGDYTLSIATVDKHSDTLLTIEDVSRVVFQVSGIHKQDTVSVWQSIWTKEEEGILNRSYTQDFEVYYANGSIEVHIATQTDV